MIDVQGMSDVRHIMTNQERLDIDNTIRLFEFFVDRTDEYHMYNGTLIQAREACGFSVRKMDDYMYLLKQMSLLQNIVRSTKTGSAIWEVNKDSPFYCDEWLSIKRGRNKFARRPSLEKRVAVLEQQVDFLRERIGLDRRYQLVYNEGDQSEKGGETE